MRSSSWILVALVATCAHAVFGQNVLTNPGFDRDLTGWAVATKISPDPSPEPGYVEASAGWGSSDASGSPVSGSAALHARAGTFSDATATVTQCVPASEGTLASFAAKFLITRQFSVAQSLVSVNFYSTTDCSGTPAGPGAMASLPGTLPPAETNSGGRWVSLTSQTLTSPGSRSMRIDAGVMAIGTSFYGLSYIDAAVDDVVLTLAPAEVSVSLLPSAGWIDGAAGSHWLTFLTLVNTGATDAAVTLSYLPHDDDPPGRGYSYLLRAGQTLVLNEEEWELSFNGTYGAIRMTSSSPSAFLQSETTTYFPEGGTVGQAVPALGPADFAGASAKTIAPIRESAGSRTNLVLANATEAPLTAHIALYDRDGLLLGERDVDLPPLGMTQINRVAASFGAGNLEAGRIAVSTPTPGGLVAAFASVIDNRTNDPRTLLPR